MVKPDYATTMVPFGIKNNNDKGQGLQYVISEVLVMLTMTTVFIALSIKKFKVRLE